MEVLLGSLSRRNLLMSSGVSARRGPGSSLGPGYKLLTGAKGQAWQGECCQTGQLPCSPASLPFHRVCGVLASSLGGNMPHSWVCHQEPNTLDWSSFSHTVAHVIRPEPFRIARHRVSLRCPGVNRLQSAQF